MLHSCYIPYNLYIGSLSMWLEIKCQWGHNNYCGVRWEEPGKSIILMQLISGV